MPLKPSYHFSINIPEGMSKRAITRKANLLWNRVKNEAPYNRSDKVQVLICLTSICYSMLRRATDYLNEELQIENQYIQHFDPDC